MNDMNLTCQQGDLDNINDITTIKAMLYDYFADIGIDSHDPKAAFIEDIEQIYLPPNCVFKENK